MLNKLLDCIRESKYIVFFGGAGVSTESGIPDFRSVDGLYNQKYKFPPETILSHSFFLNNPVVFYRFYWDKMIYENAVPNITHKVLAQLERIGKCKAVITQNIDGLHQMAGSREVLELHGSVLRNRCSRCGKKYQLSDIQDRSGIPYCDCGGIIKPEVVLYEESLDNNTLEASIQHIENADLLIVGGTSLNVYPAAGLIRYFNGKNLCLINKTITPYDRNANILMHCSLGEVFKEIESEILNANQ